MAPLPTVVMFFTQILKVLFLSIKKQDFFRHILFQLQNTLFSCYISICSSDSPSNHMIALMIYKK